MDRKWKSGASGSPPSSSENSSDGYATGGNPGAGIAATKPGPWMWHSIVEEVLAVIAAGSVTLDKTVLTQMRDALRKWGILGGQATQVLDLSGATGGQIKFPATQNQSNDGNTLDDYEEGTWTPTVGGSGGQSGQAYTHQVGLYQKIGRTVIVHFSVLLSTLGTITGDVQLKGLPFVSASTTDGVASGDVDWSGATTTFVSIRARMLYTGVSVVTLHGENAGNASPTPLAQGDLANTTRLMGTLVYRAVD